MERPAWPASTEACAIYDSALIQFVTVRMTNAAARERRLRHEFLGLHPTMTSARGGPTCLSTFVSASWMQKTSSSWDFVLAPQALGFRHLKLLSERILLGYSLGYECSTDTAWPA